MLAREGEVLWPGPVANDHGSEDDDSVPYCASSTWFMAWITNSG